ncbi:MAG: response regulator [Candidatus Zapsychrus exili]|nr:response regulator [Candidatus Zapsychrus exili]
MKQILIVEDEPKIRDLYSNLLVSEGYQVLEASDAVEATNILIRQHSIDLIILDINMPDINGDIMFGVIQEYDPSLKVLVSSVLNVDEQEELIDMAYDYFDKSEGTDVLLEKVNNILKVK